jgi:hypothetical protein
VNQKGFEPELDGKFIIINWLNKEILFLSQVQVLMQLSKQIPMVKH